jgi:flagellar basal-body rod protein FlgC
MSFLSSMNISASGMTAQRLRLDIVSENIANMQTTRTQEGGPYQRKVVVLESAKTSSFQQALQTAASGSGNTGGVIATAVLSDDREFETVYNPEHPDANEEGYVLMPNVDLTKETVDSMSATRSYEANITAFNAIKMMAQKALDIGK